MACLKVMAHLPILFSVFPSKFLCKALFPNVTRLMGHLRPTAKDVTLDTYNISSSCCFLKVCSTMNETWIKSFFSTGLCSAKTNKVRGEWGGLSSLAPDSCSVLWCQPGSGQWQGVSEAPAGRRWRQRTPFCRHEEVKSGFLSLSAAAEGLLCVHKFNISHCQDMNRSVEAK